MSFLGNAVTKNLKPDLSEKSESECFTEFILEGEGLVMTNVADGLGDGIGAATVQYYEIGRPRTNFIAQADCASLRSTNELVRSACL